MDLKEKKQIKDNAVFIGKKNYKNYLIAIKRILRNSEVVVSARGKFIQKAVDIVEISKRNGAKIKDIKLSSEKFNADGREIKVSCIEITLEKDL